MSVKSVGYLADTIETGIMATALERSGKPHGTSGIPCCVVRALCILY